MKKISKITLIIFIYFEVFSVLHHRLGWCRGLVRSRGPLGGILVHLGPILESSWGHLGVSGGYRLGRCRGLVRSRGLLGGILVHLGPILESSWGHRPKTDVCVFFPKGLRPWVPV